MKLAQSGVLLSRCAEDEPLLLLVDDAHLLDPASAETIRFIARRLVADPIALLISLRPEPEAILNGAGLSTLELAGLDAAAAVTLVARQAGEPIGPDGSAVLYEATAGNPLPCLNSRRDRTSSAGCRRNPPCPFPTPLLRRSVVGYRR